MRYRGQGHEIAVPLDGAALKADMLRQAFEATYMQLFGRIIPNLEIEAVTWTLALVATARTAATRSGCRRQKTSQSHRNRTHDRSRHRGNRQCVDLQQSDA